MKKSKKKNSTHKKRAPRKSPVHVLRTVVIVFVLLALVGFGFLSQYVQKQLKNTVIVQKGAMPSATISPAAPPIQALIPTPTKGIPPGFCLSVPVLFYHHVEPMELAKTAGHAQLTVDAGEFDNHMKYLNDRGYTSYTAEDLVNAVISHSSLPGKPVVVSLDDGYSDIHDYAFPIAKKYNIKLSLFIPTGLMGNSGYMTWDNIREMVGSGLVAAYNHTWSHYSLGRGDVEKIAYEIDTAQNQLEQYVGKKSSIFAYPYGTTSKAAMDVLKKDGFIGAFTTIGSWYQCDSALYSLPRIRIGNAPLSYFGL